VFGGVGGPTLRHRAEELLSAALAETSAKAYTSGWNQWCKFCAERTHATLAAAAAATAAAGDGTHTITNHGGSSSRTAAAARGNASSLVGCVAGVTIDPLRPDEELLIAYVTWLSLPRPGKPAGLSVQTMQTYLTSIKYHLATRGIADPTTNMLRLPLIIKGFKRKRGTARRAVRPLTITLLEHLRTVIDTRTEKGATLWSILCFGVHGLFRCGELVGPFGLLHSNIEPSISGSSITVRLDTSKTDPFGNTVRIHLHARNDITCPVRAYQNLLTIKHKLSSSSSHGGFVFTKADGTSAWERHTLVSELRASLTRLSKLHPQWAINPTEFAGHSMRRGGATSLYLRNVPELSIRRAGRWSSEAFMKYVDLSSEQYRYITDISVSTSDSIRIRELDVSQDPSKIPHKVLSFVDSDDV